MTRPDSGSTPRTEDEVVPVGTDADEQQDADAVSFLAAAILYLLAIGDVKGFAFTLGMSTVLDLVVVFLFTHPLMAALARFKSFGSSRMSGLGQVEHTRRPEGQGRQRGRELVGAGTGAGTDRSTS